MQTATVYAIHTGFALVEPLKPLFAELLPGVRVVNLVDDSLLADVRAAGTLTPAVTRRIVGYGVLAQSAGADAILNCCSSVGDAAGILARLLEIPVVRIDQPMAESAVEAGNRIAVVATLPTTLHPTARLIESIAAGRGRGVTVLPFLAEGAFDALMAGDAAAHDRILRAEVEKAASRSDVVVLAQGSMARLVPHLAALPVPVLSSPRSGVAAVAAALGTTRTA